MNKCIFLDRDGTINVEVDYLYKKEDFLWEQGAIEALFILKKLGYLLIVVTNQSGIARGKYTELDLKILHNYMQVELLDFGVSIDAFYYCPHHPEGIGEYAKACRCRKPEPEMLEQAIEKFDIDVTKSYIVGDKLSDCFAGERVGVKGVLVRTGHGEQEDVIPVSILQERSLYTFAQYIREKGES
ncbi:MAG: D-glycero-beta-D-manno-heptose 1,7-bisphosphate 7-phosphatase [Fusobacteria bacterium]|nr:D-glycero-beta-D-manno-heptose 1,7-bisphosphate 7-phosphatase [Fusobacteriota bacterium]